MSNHPTHDTPQPFKVLKAEGEKVLDEIEDMIIAATTPAYQRKPPVRPVLRLSDYLTVTSVQPARQLRCG